MAYFSRTLLTTLVLAASTSVAAQDIPVIELGESPAPRRVAQQPAPAADAVPELTIQDAGNSGQGNLSYNRSSDMLILLQQLQDEVRSLRGQLESQSRKIKRMEEEQRDRYRDLDRRISFLMSGADSRTSTPPTGSKPSSAGTVVEPSGTTSSASSAPSTAPAKAANGDDLKAYQSAFALVRQRAYDAAVDAFKGFVTDYPDSNRIANAYYWLGEIYLAQQKLEPARDAFGQVVSGYADHRKAADAAYKLGKVYSELGDKAKSAEYIELVLKNYPKSSAARLARDFKSQ